MKKRGEGEKRERKGGKEGGGRKEGERTVGRKAEGWEKEEGKERESMRREEVTEGKGEERSAWLSDGHHPSITTLPRHMVTHLHLPHSHSGQSPAAVT